MEEDSIQFLTSKDTSGRKKKKFNIDEFIFKNRWSLTLFLFGLILVGLGVFYLQSDLASDKPKVEVLESATESQNRDFNLVVEVAGAVETPGVYQLAAGDRVEDALIAAGGVSADADRNWMEKFLNRAAQVTDGQKIYIPREDEEIKGNTSASSNSGSSEGGGVVSDGMININTASQSELETLWGIGPVYAQNIIEQRPYSSVEELLTRKIIKSNVYERNKDKLTVY